MCTLSWSCQHRLDEAQLDGAARPAPPGQEVDHHTTQVSKDKRTPIALRRFMDTTKCHDISRWIL